jgi:uncharacterized protein (DUF1501 family)
MALLGSVGRLTFTSRVAEAAGAPYKALVCVFLYGGNDSNNLLVPYTDYDTLYAPVRNASNSNYWLPKSMLTPITPADIAGAPGLGKQFALNPSMSKVSTLFSKGKAALLCNVGPLVQPASPPSSYALLPPVNLYSHQDQQKAWQTSVADPNPAAPPTKGWGGLTGDNLPLGNFPAVMSTHEAALFASGAARPFVTNGLTIPSLIDTNGNASFVSQIAAGQLNQGVPDAYNQTLNQSSAYGATLRSALIPQAGFGTTGLEVELNMIANTIAGASAAASPLGVTREIFFCALGGFDTHASQAADQGGVLDGTTLQKGLLGQVDDALDSFYSCMGGLGLGSSVTTFTMSDFARTFKPASNDGSDHAWGGHHLIVGDAVLGGSIYGMDPTTFLQGYANAATGGNIYDASAVSGGPGEGRWIPQTSVDQYAATLINWLTKDLANGGMALARAVLPNLIHYGQSGWPRKLAFL